MIGTTLAHFQITDKLGQGGMGEVYRAEDSKLGRAVAIKVLPELFTADPERLARFEREARLLAALNHPHIAGIHGLEEVDGQRFLVMELAPGDDLSEWIARGPIPVQDALEIALQVARALEAAHQQNIVHRDLKPANVKVTAEGKVKVLDFGLAKAWEPEVMSGPGALVTQSPTLTQQMTQAGVILGTAAYMSPEQARGKPVDKRADVWAWGALLVEMLTGRQAFGGETVTDVFASIVAREPEWERIPPGVPPGIQRLLRRCLEKDPDQRLHSIADARIEVEEVLRGGIAELSVIEGQPTGTGRERLWQGAALVLAVALGVVGYHAWSLARVEAPVVRSFIPAPEGTRFDLDSASPGLVAVSPQGDRLAFSAVDEDGTIRLWVRDLDDLAARPLAGTEDAAYPFWSPDGRFVAFFDSNRLKKVDVTGAPPVTLCEAPNGKGGSWSSDGVILFAPAHNTPIHRVAAAGGQSTPVTEVDPERQENSHRFPVFLPDGDHFLFLARVGTGGVQAEQNRVFLASLSQGGEPRELLANPSGAVFASGHLLFVREGTLMAQPFDAGRLELTGEAFPIAEEILYFPGAVRAVFAASANGVLVYHTGEAQAAGSQLVWRGLDGVELGTVGEIDAQSNPRISPDGNRVLVNSADRESGNQDLWIHDLERGLRSRFTFDPGQELAAVWSPDGERIVFSSNRREGRDDLWVKPVGGGQEPELLFADGKDRYPFDWTADGRHLLLIRVDDLTNFDLEVLTLGESNEPVPIQSSEEFDESYPVVSPDGRWLAYSSDESGREEIYVTSFPGGGAKWQVSAAGGFTPYWAPQGGRLYFLAPDATLMAAEVKDSGSAFQVGTVTELFATGVRMAGAPQYHVAPDGERLLFVVPAAAESTPPPLTLVVNWPGAIETR